MARVLGWVALILLVMFVVRNPANAADLAHGLLAGTGKVADGLGRFAAGMAR